MATKIRLDMDTLTLGDLELFEQACGGDLLEALAPQRVLDKDGRPVPDPNDPKGRPLQQIKVSARTMVGLVYVALHKEDSSLTIEQVKAMPLNDLDFDLAGADNSGDEPDPTEQSEGDSAPEG